MKLVSNFTHTPGVHCGSTALSDLLRYIGLDYSEAMCFGLGSGLGFYYFRDPRGGSPSHLIHGRTLDLERDACTHLALDFEEGADDDADRAWQTARDFIDRDIPVLLHVELSQLPYYHARTPFPGHRVVLAGYDDTRRIAFLADTKFPGLQEVSYENLHAARTAQIEPLPLRNEWLAIKRPPLPHPPLTKGRAGVGSGILAMTLQDAIRAALRDNARGMVLDRAPHQGIMGMETLAEDFENWGDANDWVVCALIAYQNIEVRGTGGGFFRKMYAQFLREAQMVEFAQTLDEIANGWSTFAQLLKHIAGKKDRMGFAEASRTIRRLALREENFWGKVLDAVS